MVEWQKSSLGKIIDVKHGFAFKGVFFQTQPNGVILSTPGNFKIGGGWKEDKCKYFNGEIPGDFKFVGGELVVTMTDLSKESDTLGYPALIPINSDNIYLHNQRIGLVSIISDLADKKFLYWLMCDNQYRFHIVSSASGSTVSHTSPTRIKEYEFYLPPLPEQKAIASVLSSLDDKIDLLHRQNKTLETMAETLFRQWFVEEAQDEKINYAILGDLVSVIDNRGKTPPYQDIPTDYPLIEVNVLTGEDILINYSEIRKYVTEDVHSSWFRGYLKKFDILLSTVGSIGECAMYLAQIGNIAQNVIGLSPVNISPTYLYYYLKFVRHLIQQLDIGAVQPSIKVPHLLSLEVPVPKTENLEKFDGITKSFLRKIEGNQGQIQKLEQLRNTLLPKLMSGEVRVNYG